MIVKKRPVAKRNRKQITGFWFWQVLQEQMDELRAPAAAPGCSARPCPRIPARSGLGPGPRSGGSGSGQPCANGSSPARLSEWSTRHCAGNLGHARSPAQGHSSQGEPGPSGAQPARESRLGSGGMERGWGSARNQEQTETTQHKTKQILWAEPV